MPRSKTLTRVSLVVEVFMLGNGPASTEEFVQAIFDRHAKRLKAVVGLDNGSEYEVPRDWPAVKCPGCGGAYSATYGVCTKCGAEAK